MSSPKPAEAEKHGNSTNYSEARVQLGGLTDGQLGGCFSEAGGAVRWMAAREERGGGGGGGRG
jgi:hypothetical protein